MNIRALLIAEACNPEWVSVPLEGWSHSQAIARAPGIQAHLVTQIRNRDAIARTGLQEGKDFTAIDSEKVDRVMWKIGEKLRGGAGKGWTTVMAAMSFGYYYFERRLWQELGHRISAGEWDIVHRITPLSPTVPSLLAAKCAKVGIPFVVGPLNGGVPWPKGFDSARRSEREWLSYIRSAYKLLPGYRSMRRHASAIVVGSRDTEALEPKWVSGKLHYIPENAVDPSRFTVRRTRQATTPLKVAFVGRLVPYKGCDMLLEAVAPHIRAGAVHVTVIGDGPERPRLEALIAQENIASGVELAGWVPHTQLQERLAQCDVFGFPSIREFGGGAVLEAMAVGLVPVVVRYGGPGELVTPDTGFLVDIGPRETIVADVRRIIGDLAAQPSLVDSLSTAARQRVFDHFTWDVKASQTVRVYQSILAARTPSHLRPAAPPPPAAASSHSSVPTAR